MAERKEPRKPSRKKVILLLAAAGLPLFGILFSLSSFELRFINPRTNQQTVSLVALTLLVSLLFGALTFVLFRNLIKLFAAHVDFDFPIMTVHVLALATVAPQRVGC